MNRLTWLAGLIPAFKAVSLSAHQVRYERAYPNTPVSAQEALCQKPLCLDWAIGLLFKHEPNSLP
jgi:hypothetical protein